MGSENEREEGDELCSLPGSMPAREKSLAWVGAAPLAD